MTSSHPADTSGVANMDLVDSAEKEASEVLHSLLSVERIEKHSQHHTQVVVVSSGSDLTGHEDHWTGPTFANMVAQVDHVLWQGHTVQIDQAGNICQTIQPQEQYVHVQEDTLPIGDQKVPHLEIVNIPQCDNKPTPKKKRRKLNSAPPKSDPTVLEENAQQVRERFEKGCECAEEDCFKGLSAENVYRHRLNIAELTKAEHDMYLMGVTMAVLTNPEETVRRKERRRLRAQYVFQGRRVCLDAFLYLENCTHYQLKRIRKHVMTHGVAPRVHGNHGKKPHNTFPLDIYRQATDFLRHYIEQYTPPTNSPHLNAALLKQKAKGTHRNTPFYLPSEITRKTIHNAYKDYCEECEPESHKLMGYSTFRHFMKEQFPHVKFCNKMDSLLSLNGKTCTSNSQSGIILEEEVDGDLQEVQQVTTIPVVISHGAELSTQESTTYIVTPNQTFTEYQLTPLEGQVTSISPTSYAVHQGTITMAATPPGTYAFTTL